MGKKANPDLRSAQGAGALKSQIKANDNFNRSAYDRLTVRIPIGNREKLLDHMQTMLLEIDRLEKAERTAEQDSRLEDLKALYQVSDRGIPSINHLICELIKRETGIDMFRTN